MSFLDWGVQIWTQHLKCGIARAEYRGMIPALFLLPTPLLIQRRVLLAFLATSAWPVLLFPLKTFKFHCEIPRCFDDELNSASLRETFWCYVRKLLCQPLDLWGSLEVRRSSSELWRWVLGWKAEYSFVNENNVLKLGGAHWWARWHPNGDLIWRPGSVWLWAPSWPQNHQEWPINASIALQCSAWCEHTMGLLGLGTVIASVQASPWRLTPRLLRAMLWVKGV